MPTTRERIYSVLTFVHSRTSFFLNWEADGSKTFEAGENCYTSFRKKGLNTSRSLYQHQGAFVEVIQRDDDYHQEMIFQWGLLYTLFVQVFVKLGCRWEYNNKAYEGCCSHLQAHRSQSACNCKSDVWIFAKQKNKIFCVVVHTLSLYNFSWNGDANRSTTIEAGKGWCAPQTCSEPTGPHITTSTHCES